MQKKHPSPYIPFQERTSYLRITRKYALSKCGEFKPLAGPDMELITKIAKQEEQIRATLFEANLARHLDVIMDDHGTEKEKIIARDKLRALIEGDSQVSHALVLPKLLDEAKKDAGSAQSDVKVEQ